MPRISKPPAQREAFAKKLQTLMNEHGWNQSETARRATTQLPRGSAPILRSQINKYLKAESWPMPAALKALADAFKVPQEALYSSPAMPVVRSPQQVQGGVSEEASLRQIGPDMAWISINQAVSWPVALEIMKLLKGNR